MCPPGTGQLGSMPRQTKHHRLGLHVSSVPNFSENFRRILTFFKYFYRRQCDSHFSGPECWSKSLSFYSNDLMRSMVLYKNAIAQVRPLDSQLSSFQLGLDLTLLASATDQCRWERFDGESLQSCSEIHRHGFQFGSVRLLKSGQRHPRCRETS